MFCCFFVIYKERIMNNELLPEYQKYLRVKSLVEEKYIIDYAYWARKFLAF
jgi:hypothetical protein